MAFLILVLPALHGQDNKLFTPFISRLRAEAGGNAIVLTWKDSADIDGDYLIYRHTEEIVENNFLDAVQVGIVSSGTQQFTDHPYDSHRYYYLVLCRDSDKTYNLFIPFRNKTTSPVAVEYLAQETDRAALVTSIETATEEDYIKLTFSSDKPERELIIYRSSEVIAFEEDLLTSTIVSIQPGTRGVYIDYAVPGVPYYYGVFDADLLKAGSYRFSPGENITLKPVKVKIQEEKLAQAEERVRRNLPLPLLILPSQITDGSPLASSVGLNLPETRELSPGTEEAVGKIMAWLPESEAWKPKPVIMAGEKEPELTGTRKSLQEIAIKIQNENFTEAQDDLQRFLRTRRSADIENRSRFYLGQCYYFNGTPRKALIEWLYIRDDLYLETAPWIDTVFKELKQSGENDS